MNKQQQIEEIAGTICNACKERFEISKKCKNVIEPCLAAYAHAEALYNAGYRKLPEDSVVLSREEYDSLRLQIQQAHNKGVQAGFDMTKFKEQSIRKQAIKEFAEKLKERYVDENLLFDGYFKIIDELLQENKQ